jgi:hypothetical protein
MESQESGGVNPGLEPFIEAFNAYRQALERLASSPELPQRLAEAQRNAVQSWNEAFVPRELQQQATDMYRDFAQAAVEAKSLEDLQHRAGDAYTAYQDLLKDQVSPQLIQDRVTRVYSDYARKLKEVLAPEQAQEEIDTAYREYLAALKAAWAKVDPESLNLQTLNALLQTVMAAGWMRATSLAGARQRWAAAASVTAATAAGRGTVK